MNTSIDKLKETTYDLLSFCDMLTDEMIANNALERCPTDKECTYFAKKYRELADRSKELGVEL